MSKLHFPSIVSDHLEASSQLQGDQFPTPAHALLNQGISSNKRKLHVFSYVKNSSMDASQYMRSIVAMVDVRLARIKSESEIIKLRNCTITSNKGPNEIKC